MQESVKYWDKLSTHDISSIRKLGKTSTKIVELTTQHLSFGDTILDIGCGPAAITTELSSKVQEIYALDFSSGMLKNARERAAELEIDNIKFIHSTLDQADFDDKSFDVILAFNVLPYLNELSNAIQKIHDLLRPGGFFISSTACLAEKSRIVSFILSVLGKIGIVPKMRFYNTTELTDSLNSGNFNIVESELLTSIPDYFIVARKI